nr:MAG TPA: hypothetical protein [Bacteriophage sp.]
MRDNYGNWKNFSIINKGTEEKPDYFLKFTGNYNEVTSEFYERDENGNIKKVQGRRVWLDREKQKNPDKVVLLLNIKAIVTLSATDEEG